MKMNWRNIGGCIILVLAISACTTNMYMKEAKRLYDVGEYGRADGYYSKAESALPEATKMRARCKYKMRDIQGSILLYQSADKTTFEAEDWKNFINSLNQVGRGSEIQAYLAQAGIQNDTLLTSVSKVHAEVTTAKAADMAWNSNGYAFAPVMVEDRIYYVGNDRNVKHFQDVYGGDISSYLDVRSVDPMLSDKKPLPLNKINSGQHDGPIAVHPDGNKIVITRNAPFSKKPGGGRPQLYELQKIRGRWRKAKRMSICKDNGSFMHPAFNQDGSVLYYSSNKGEGNGFDIYFSTKDSIGGWSDPLAVPDINTSGDEVFPSCVDGILYFSSDARVGMGGLDIYGYDLKTRKIFWPAAPVNSRRDDFNLVKAGFSNSLWYVSSNRLTADGRDNVLKLEFLPGTFAKVHFYDVEQPDMKLSFRRANVKSAIAGTGANGKNYDLDIQGNAYLNLDTTLTFAVDSFEVAKIGKFESMPLPFMIGSVEIPLKRSVFAEEGETANEKGGKPIRNIIVKDNGSVENAKDDRYMNIRLVDDEYLVVAGAFRRTNKIDAFIKELKDAGYSQAKKGGVHNGLTYVIYGSAKNRTDAMTLLIDARKHNPEAWIMRQAGGSTNDQKGVSDVVTAGDLKPIEAIFVSSELDDKSKYYVALNKNNVVIVAKGFYGPKCLTDPDARVQGKYLISPEKGLVVDFGEGLVKWKANVNKQGNVTQISGVLPGQTSVVVMQFLATLKGM